MDKLRPHLACDIDLETVRFPLIGMPKIDGVRGLHITGGITGRSLKAFKNAFVGERYKSPFLAGLDGELALGKINAPRLCSETTGFVNRKTAREGKPTESEELVWHIFDCLTPEVENAPYYERLAIAESIVVGFSDPRIKIVEHTVINSLAELEEFDANCIAAGFEGSIFRDPMGKHKSGRASAKASSKTVNAYLRLKRFVDFEVRVVGLEEAMENTNEKKTNELGQSERSSHQENMVPKGMIGTIKGEVLTDVEYLGKVYLPKGMLIDIGPGEMSHADRKRHWDQRNMKGGLIAQIGKVKFFPHGQKDKPRFPTWISLRAEEDMS